MGLWPQTQAHSRARVERWGFADARDDYQTGRQRRACNQRATRGAVVAIEHVARAASSCRL